MMYESEIEKIEQIDNMTNCEFCRDGLTHTCEYTDQKIPKILAEMGVKRKILQKFPNKEIHVPYWTSRHQYDISNPHWGRTSIVLSPFHQSGSTHYFGVINLGTADAISKVPALPAATNSQEICKRTIDQVVTDQYQRPIESERIENLRIFLEGNPTIVNPVIMEISKSALLNKSARIIDEDGRKVLKIDLQKIKEIAASSTDVNPKKGLDFRPLEIADGQHRIRSCGLSEKAVNTVIPFILIDPDFEGGGGRIFAEINVQMNALDDLHKLHLRYILNLSSHKDSEDFGKYPDDLLHENHGRDDAEQKKYFTRFSNRLSYKLGARLNSIPNGPMYDKILFYGKAKDSEGKFPIDAKDWLKITTPWMSQFPELVKDEDLFVKVLNTYFEAWRITSNTDPNTGEKYINYDSQTNNRWGKGKSKVGRSAWSKAFLKIMFTPIIKMFPLTYQLSGINPSSSSEEILNSFKKILLPAAPIDFLDWDAWELIMGPGLKTKERDDYISQWLNWAIYDYHKTGILKSPEKAWNINNGIVTDVLSNPGEGFFSPINPGNFTGTLSIENIPFSKEEGLNGSTITITADEIPNESYAKTITMMYTDSKGVSRPERRNKFVKGHRSSIGFNFASQRFLTSSKTHGIQSLTITITSRNLFSPGPVTIFSHTYTIDELRRMNNSEIFLSNRAFTPKVNSSAISIEHFDVEEESNTNHFAIDLDEDKITTSKEDRKASINDYQDQFQVPPPVNFRIHSHKSFEERIRFMPKINPCQACFVGAHDPASCGFNKYSEIY